jgi:hypothetical protein
LPADVPNSRVDCATDTAAIASSPGHGPAFEYAGDEVFNVIGAGGTVAMARLMNEEGEGERRDLA